MSARRSGRSDTPQALRLVYFAPSDIQVARVDRQCIINFCDALRRIGVDVELVAIGIELLDGEASSSNPLDLYRIREHFPVRIVPTNVHQTSPDWWVGLNRFVVHLRRAFHETLHARRNRLTVFYAKNYGPALTLLLLRQLRRDRIRVAFEPHLPPPSRLHAAILRACDHIFANTHLLADHLIEKHGLDRRRVVGTHQGVDLELYDELRVDAPVARAALDLPSDGMIVGYTGKVVWGYREIEYILEAAKSLRDRSDVRFLIVGGRADHVQRYRVHAEQLGLRNVIFAGFVAPNHVQTFQFAADILLLYYPSGISINEYRSPGKLFEYMAAGRPVVSVDLPVLREVLGDADPVAVLVRQDDPEELVRAIAGLLEDHAHRQRLARRALERVQQYSWRARAELVRDSIVADVDGAMKNSSSETQSDAPTHVSTGRMSASSGDRTVRVT